MKICIIGVGGVGGYFGARLAATGHEVFFIARGATLETLCTQGLRVESPLGDLHLQNVAATDNPVEVGEVDVVILGVKTWQVPSVAEAARPLVGAGTAILPLQNGIETTDQLVAVFGPRPVLGGTCRISAAIVEPGRIRHMGVAPWIALGELDGRTSPRVRRLAAALEGAGIAVEVSPEIRAEIWRKFLLIASTSGVGAVARRPLADLRANPDTLQLMRRAMEEVAALAAARGVVLADDVVETTLDFVMGLPDHFTTSMQRDIMEGRASELDSLSGAVVRAGRRAAVATPVHDFIHSALIPQETAARRTTDDTSTSWRRRQAA